MLALACPVLTPQLPSTAQRSIDILGDAHLSPSAIEGVRLALMLRFTLCAQRDAMWHDAVAEFKTGMCSVCTHTHTFVHCPRAYSVATLIRRPARPSAMLPLRGGVVLEGPADGAAGQVRRKWLGTGLRRPFFPGAGAPLRCQARGPVRPLTPLAAQGVLRGGRAHKAPARKNRRLDASALTGRRARGASCKALSGSSSRDTPATDLRLAQLKARAHVQAGPCHHPAGLRPSRPLTGAALGYAAGRELALFHAPLQRPICWPHVALVGKPRGCLASRVR